VILPISSDLLSAAMKPLSGRDGTLGSYRNQQQRSIARAVGGNQRLSSDKSGFIQIDCSFETHAKGDLIGKDIDSQPRQRGRYPPCLHVIGGRQVPPL